MEQAAAGHTVALRGGRVLLVDRAGRYWGYVRDVSRAHRLECYDPAQKQWLPPRLAAGLEKADSSEPLSKVGEWHDPLNSQGSFEDAAGNLYFLGGAWRDSGFGMHRRAADGT